MSAARFYNLENLTIDEQALLIEDLSKLQGVKPGVCIPAGYHNTNHLPTATPYIFELSHDLHHVFFLPILRFKEDDKESQKLLRLILQTEHDGKFFPADCCIIADYTNQAARQYYAIILSHAVMVGRNIYGEMTAQVIDENVISAGNQAQVCEQLGTLRYRGGESDARIVFERARRERVVRIARVFDTADGRAEVQRVAALAPSYSHLGTRGMVFFSASANTKKPGVKFVYAAQSMHSIEECDLHDLIRKVQSLSLAKRFNLLLASARALYCDAHIHGIAHRDFKAENVRVKETVLGYIARLIDYHDAIKSGEVYDKRVGTPDYMSEEALKCRADQPADIFALYGLACILFNDKEQHRIWSFDTDDYQAAFEKIIARRKKVKWEIKPSLFHDLLGLSEKTEEALTRLFASMAKRRPEERITILDFINQLENIYLSHQLETTPAHRQIAMVTSHAVAQQVRKELDICAATTFTSLENADRLKEYLLFQISSLPDKPDSLDVFARVTGILCLHRISTIEGAKIRLTGVFDDFRAAFEELDIFCTTLRNIYEATGKTGLIEKQINALTTLSKQISDLNTFKNKIQKSPLDLNNIPGLIQHVSQKMEKIRTSLVAYESLCDEVRPSSPRFK